VPDTGCSLKQRQLGMFLLTCEKWLVSLEGGCSCWGLTAVVWGGSRLLPRAGCSQIPACNSAAAGFFSPLGSAAGQGEAELAVQSSVFY